MYSQKPVVNNKLILSYMEFVEHQEQKECKYRKMNFSKFCTYHIHFVFISISHSLKG